MFVPASLSGLLLSLLVTLGRSPCTLASSTTGGNVVSQEGLLDVCDYTDGKWRCGDQCAWWDSLCECGDKTLRNEYTPSQHCCTNTSCTWSRGKVLCPGGRVLDISAPCEDGSCYSSYNSTLHLNYDSSRFSCTGQASCLSINAMCQGLTSCGDNHLCDEQLRWGRVGKRNIKSLNTSLVQHSYCNCTIDDGNKAYDRIDRSDENIINTINIKESPVIDYRYLTLCNSSWCPDCPGVTCHYTPELSPDTATCYDVEGWCRSDRPGTCVTSQSGNLTAKDDSTLCSNHTFWQNVGTDSYSYYNYNVKKLGSGVRCKGRMMHTIYPWYRYYNGQPYSRLKPRCDDKSDQVFVAKKPCPNRTYYLGVHKSEWCSTELASDKLICTNPSAWLNTTFIDQAMLDDPHDCQASCAAPGLNCIACTNKDYFPCSKSNTCIHPSLQCDGHPQCPDNEDEAYEMCKPIYVDKKLVKNFATYKCNSTMYPQIFTIATA